MSDQKVIQMPTNANAKPREMTLDDKRIVFEKLSDVYVSKDVGYDAGWNDDAVAKDLGCPRIWVEDIRNNFFGPAKSSAVDEAFIKEVDAKLTEAKRIFQETENLVAKATQLLQQARGVNSGIVPLERRVLDMKKRMGIQ